MHDELTLYELLCTKITSSSTVEQVFSDYCAIMGYDAQTVTTNDVQYDISALGEQRDALALAGESTENVSLLLTWLVSLRSYVLTLDEQPVADGVPPPADVDVEFENKVQKMWSAHLLRAAAFRSQLTRAVDLLSSNAKTHSIEVDDADKRMVESALSLRFSRDLAQVLDLPEGDALLIYQARTVPVKTAQQPEPLARVISAAPPRQQHPPSVQAGK